MLVTPRRSLVVSAQAEHTRPLPNPPLDGSLGQSHHPQSIREQGVCRAGSGGDSDYSAQNYRTLSCVGLLRADMRSGGGGGVPHKRGEIRYLSGSTERVQEEELKQQQNRNRNNEEGLQSGGEGKQKGLGMAPDLANYRH